ncbi:trans-4-hydroxy-L-proline dehydratase activase [Desulforamulus ruminis]|uniref:trans-4-hydroxy-L-proline dehydratase activase n=1 Tax=Desulforamulus ruminis TaxID=1564 RepID=UPI003B005E54
MTKARIFNIQKFCIHDGPGIRTTVFFKGCPLSCLWCHNPESQNFSKEIFYHPEKCVQCGQCLTKCKQGAVERQGEILTQDRRKCVACGECTDFCSHNAREIAGREYSLDELLAEIEKDRPFYEQSKGGVTLSGGEALCQIDFVADLVKACQKRGISVAVDTCGQVPFSSFERILDFVDIFLYDIKIMDPVLHEKYAGQSNRLILENLRRLVERGARVYLRLPLIEGVNTQDDNIREVIAFIKGMNLPLIHLLPYHDMGKSKYLRLNREYPGPLLKRPSDERLEQIKSLFEASQFKVKIGG